MSGVVRSDAAPLKMLLLKAPDLLPTKASNDQLLTGPGRRTLTGSTSTGTVWRGLMTATTAAVLT